MGFPGDLVSSAVAILQIVGVPPDVLHLVLMCIVVAEAVCVECFGYRQQEMEEIALCG